MTLPTPLRMARAIALFQGWAAGLGVLVMVGVAVIAAGGLRNGAFVALALLFLAGDVFAVSVAVVIAARRLAEGAAWARLLLDVVEGVTIAVGLVATMVGTGLLGLLGVVLGVTVIACLHAPSSNPVFAGQSLLPWERSVPQRPPEPAFPVPELPRPRRSGSARPMSSVRPMSAAPPPVAPSTRRPVAPPAWKPSTPDAPRRYSWEAAPTPMLPVEPVARPAGMPSVSERTIPPIEPLPPVSQPEVPLTLLTPPVVPPPDEPPGRPFVVPPLERLGEGTRHPVPAPPPEDAEAPAVRPFVVPIAGEEEEGEEEEEPAAAATAEPTTDELPAPAAVVNAVASAPPVPPTVPAGTPQAPAGGTWEPRPLPPPVAVAVSSAPPRRGVITVFERHVLERRPRASGRSARSGLPPAPSWGWRKVVITASLLGAVAGGTLSAVELITGGGTHLPATGQAPLQPPRSGSLPGGTGPAPGAPGDEPAAAGGVAGITITPEGSCAAGSTCTVTVRVDLEPHPDELVAWTLVVSDRCSTLHSETAVTGVSAPANYHYVTSTNQVTVPAWRSPLILAVTTSPARASSQPLLVGGPADC